MDFVLKITCVATLTLFCVSNACIQTNDMELNLITKAFARYCYASQVSLRAENRVDNSAGIISREPKIDKKTFGPQGLISNTTFVAGNQTYSVKLGTKSKLLNEVDSSTKNATDTASSKDGFLQKEGKFLPLPIGIYQYTPNQPLPLGSIFAFAILIIMPYVPFGSIEITYAFGWDANYIALRLNGEPDTSGIVAGRSFEKDQFDLYGYIEDLLSNTYGLDGKACVQRLICELAEVPIKDQSFLGEAVHFLLEPRKGKTKMLDDYLEAETQGLTYGNCREVYGQCPLSIRKFLPEEFVKKELLKKKRKRSSYHF